MSANQSNLSYEDCYEVLDRALEADHGIRVSFDDNSAAYNFRQRCHYARKLSRIESRSIYLDPSDPQRGKSVYDPLVISLREKAVHITKRKAPLNIEELDPDD